MLLDYFPLSRCSNRSHNTAPNLLFQVKMSEPDPKIRSLYFQRLLSDSEELFRIRFPFAKLLFVVTIRRPKLFVST